MTFTYWMLFNMKGTTCALCVSVPWQSPTHWKMTDEHPFALKCDIYLIHHFPCCLLHHSSMFNIKMCRVRSYLRGKEQCIIVPLVCKFVQVDTHHAGLLQLELMLQPGIGIVHSHNNSVFAKGIFACGEHVLFLRNLK